MSDLKPFYQNVQSHYDLSDDFFALFLDPTRVYSCAYFERDDMTLEEAQWAKIDLSLGKCDLKPGMRLLDIGCGWGACLRRAHERHDVKAVGLTLSKNQHQHVTQNIPGVEARLQGWEEFDEPVDRIVSIGAFEHFRRSRYAAFFERCFSILPEDGRMMLHSIVWPSREEMARNNLALDHERVLFAKFIRKEIFPGGELCNPEEVIDHAQRAGFKVTQVQSLRPHYARTLKIWAANLEARREEALALNGQVVYDRYMKYLTGCARDFDSGHLDLKQFTLCK